MKHTKKKKFSISLDLSAQRNRLNRGTPGFTLMELIMVIVIIGILAAIVIPRFESFYAIKLDGATKKVVSDIRYTQQLAVTRHTNSRIIFSADNDNYLVEEENPQGSDNWVSVIDPFTRRVGLSVDFNTDAQYQGIDIQSTDFGDTLQFDWQGIPQLVGPAGSLILFYRGINRTISIKQNTGRVSVQ